MNPDQSEYHLVVNTGIMGSMPEFSVTRKQFKGLGEFKNFNLTDKWLKFQKDIELAFEETVLGL